MMESIKRLLVGVEHDPKVVGAVRAAVLYLLPIGAGALVAYLGAIHDPRWLWLTALIPVIRALEGAVIDQTYKARQNDYYPTPPAGETPPAAIPPATPPAGIP
jgi:hypothetical protein